MSTRNPLIADNDTHQTLHNASCVLSYLSPSTGAKIWTTIPNRAMLLFDTVRDALNHEKERVLKKHVKAASKEGAPDA